MTGVLLLGVVAVGLGIAALVRIRRHGTRGRGLAWTGIGLGVVGVAAAGVAVALVVSWATARSPLSTDVTEARTVAVQRLVPGHCLAEVPADGPLTTVTVTPCDGPHAAEVSGTVAFDDASWPGQAEADARTARACRLGSDDVAAGARALAWAPTAAGWRLGDRTGTCVVVAPAEPGTQV